MVRMTKKFIFGEIFKKIKIYNFEAHFQNLIISQNFKLFAKL